MNGRRLLTFLSSPLLGWLSPLRRRLLRMLPFESLTQREQIERRELARRNRAPCRLANGLERWCPLPDSTPLRVLSPSYFREQPFLFKANLCRLLGLRRLEERLLTRAAEELAERCGPIREDAPLYKGWLAAEIEEERVRLGLPV